MFGLTIWVVASRLPFVTEHPYLGMDRPLYVAALALDDSFAVPMPGNIGFVLLGKLAQLIFTNPLDAYTAVTIGLSVLAAVAVYLLACLFVPSSSAALASFAMTCNPVVWWHGTATTSYLVWLACLPLIAWFGIRFAQSAERAALLGLNLSFAISTILRPDMLLFAGPLWLICLVCGRPRLIDWLASIFIVACACAVWFGLTAWVLGGAGEYLQQVFERQRFHEQFAIWNSDLGLGLVRNLVKYILFLSWGAWATLPLAAAALWFAATRTPRPLFAATVLVCAVAPSLYFSLLVFMGNAGLVFPLLPALYIAAAWMLEPANQRSWPVLRRSAPLLSPSIYDERHQRGARRSVLIVFALAGIAQSLLAGPLKEDTRRDVILNITFFKYTPAGLMAGYYESLAERGIPRDMTFIWQELRQPSPLRERRLPVPSSGEGR